MATRNNLVVQKPPLTLARWDLSRQKQVAFHKGVFEAGEQATPLHSWITDFLTMSVPNDPTVVTLSLAHGVCLLGSPQPAFSLPFVPIPCKQMPPEFWIRQRRRKCSRRSVHHGMRVDRTIEDFWKDRRPRHRFAGKASRFLTDKVQMG
jgi:hypothetical protein